MYTDTMDTDTITLLIILVGIMVWSAMTFLQGRMRMHRELASIIAKHVHEIKVEQHGNITYWFDKETDQFYAQGVTIDECVAVLKQHYANDVFIYNAADKNQYLLAGPDFDLLLLTPGGVPPEGSM